MLVKIIIFCVREGASSLLHLSTQFFSSSFWVDYYSGKEKRIGLINAN